MPACERAGIACSPHVSFVGYSIPHPSEKVVNLRIQTTGAPTIPIKSSNMAYYVRSRNTPVIFLQCLCIQCQATFVTGVCQPHYNACSGTPAEVCLQSSTHNIACREREKQNMACRLLAGEVTAVEALRQACQSLKQLCGHMQSTFNEAYEQYEQRKGPDA